MSTNAIILLIVLGGTAALVGATWLGYYLAKKGVDVKKIETTADKLTAWAVNAASAIAPYLSKPYSTMVSALTAVVAKVVQITETLYNAGKLSADQRKVVATDIIEKELTDAKIKVDANVEKLISVAIDAACLLLPHHISAPVQATTPAQPAQTTATK